MPRATAKRGTRRIPVAVRSLLGRSLPRERAAEFIREGELCPARCSVIWNVGGLAVAQPIGEVAIPRSLDLLPVRRVGTYKGAPNAIAMFPVMRDGYALMLTVESLLELHHLTRLSFDPGITAMYAQPCAMVWKHEEGHLHHVPDLAAVRDGQLELFDVKREDQMSDPWVRIVLELTAETCRSVGVPFTVLGDVSRQMAHNLLLVSRYRWPNPFLAAECAAVLRAQPETVGGGCRVVESLRSGGNAVVDASDFSVSSIRVGQQVVKHLIAVGECRIHLDRPIGLASELTWIADDGARGRSRYDGA